MSEPVSPENCPTPIYHETHFYCPSCTWVAEDAPVSEAEAQRGRADHLHTELGVALDENDLLREIVEWCAQGFAADEAQIRTGLGDRHADLFVKVTGNV